MIKGTPPTPRDSHSCTTVGDNLYVFGGTDGTNPLRDLHILDTCKLFDCLPFICCANIPGLLYAGLQLICCHISV